jgi:hypothetical protein
MWLISGQKDRLAGLDAVRLIRNRNFGFSFDNLDERIECGGVFCQTLVSE